MRDRLTYDWQVTKRNDAGVAVRSERVDPVKGEAMTTIQVTESLRDDLRDLPGRNYTERIINLDQAQTCVNAANEGEGVELERVCGRKATHAKWFHAGPDLFVAMPLCGECLKKCEIEHGEHVYADGEAGTDGKG